MLFQIDLNSAKPVYQQMMDQVKFAVAAGRLRTNDRLPSIRDVAVQARVNRNTVARVYSELEREGVIYTHAGQGAFISDRGSQLSRAEQRRQLTARIDEMLAEAHLFGFTGEQIQTLFEQRLRGVLPAREVSSGTGGKG